jgi:DNA-binding MarR family transcriptional regulator
MDPLLLSMLRLGQAVRVIGLEEARSVGLTPVQAETLLFIGRTKSFATSIGRLAGHLGVSHASAVGVVDGLEARGLIERTGDTRDRRITRLRLTPAGHQVMEGLGRWGWQLTQALEGLTVEERKALERGLGAVIWSLRRAGYLEVAEPCRGCTYFAENVAPGQPEPHHCRLIDRFLSEEEARKDCPDHTPIRAPAGRAR